MGEKGLRMMWRGFFFPYLESGGEERYCRSHERKSRDFVIFVVWTLIPPVYKVLQQPQSIFHVIFLYCTPPKQKYPGEAGAGTQRRGCDSALYFFYPIVTIFFVSLSISLSNVKIKKPTLNQN